MKILVTGGAGFTGSNFIRLALALGKGYAVVNYHNYMLFEQLRSLSVP